MKKLKLGLIGVGIEKSQAPDLHRLAGHLCGISITYDLIQLESPASENFDEVFSKCQSESYCGVNVTHPFKERAAEVVPMRSEPVRRLGAVNTIRFDSNAETEGFNTDYSRFKKA